MEILIQAFIAAQSSLRPILSQLQSGGKDQNRALKRGRDELHLLDNVDTIYGTVIGDLPIVNDSGDIVLVKWINPFALLAHSCSISLGFFRLMQACMQQTRMTSNGVLRFIL